MITVASYNIHKAVGTDGRRNPARILAVMGELDADVIAVQEADRRFGARASVLPHSLIDKAGWRPVIFGRRAASMGWHGNMILVRPGITIVEGESITLPAIEPRGAVMAHLQTAAGTRFRVVGMHLDLSGLRRRRQARAIVAHVAAGGTAIPTIMMGDMNEWSAMLGCLHEFARDYRIADTGPSFHARRPLAALDRIMMSRDLRVVGCGVHGSRLANVASDHLPVWATIEGVR